MQVGQVNKAVKVYLAAAEQHGLTIGQHDFWNQRYGLGLDEGQRKLFYWHDDAHDPQEVVVELNEVRKCTVNNVYREVNGNRIIDMIGLRLTMQGARSPELYLSFYDKEGSMMLSNELPLAEKWNGIIQASTAASPQAVKV